MEETGDKLVDNIMKNPLIEYLDNAKEMGIVPIIKRRKLTNGNEFYKLYVGGVEIFFENKVGDGWVYTGWGFNTMPIPVSNKETKE